MDICLYGDHSLWYLTKRVHLGSGNSIHVATYDEFEDSDITTKIVNNVAPSVDKIVSFENRLIYENEQAVKLFQSHGIKPTIVKRFHQLNDHIELLSTSHVLWKNQILAIDNLNLEQRQELFGLLFPNVFDSELCVIKNNNSIVFGVSSCITPILKENRGIITPRERLMATVEQGKSIQMRCPLATSFLLEHGSLNLEEMHLLSTSFDQVVLFEKDQHNNQLASKNKSFGESYVISWLLSHLIDKFDLFFRMNGRYKLIHTFDLNSFSKEKPTFRVTQKHISYSRRGNCESILYSVPYHLKDYLIQGLKHLTQYQHQDIEHQLYSIFCPRDDLSKIQQVEQLGALGYCSGCAGMYNYV